MKVTPGGSRSRTIWTQSDSPHELETLRSYPSVYLPSAAIPNPGDHAERVSFGVPLFAVRGRDGRARVFRNACRHRGMALVEGPAVRTRWCAAITAGPIASTARCRTSPTPRPSPTWTCPPAGLVEVDSREVDGLIVIGPLQPPTSDSSAAADAAMAALADGSPWRDKLLPRRPAVSCETHSRGR